MLLEIEINQSRFSLTMIQFMFVYQSPIALRITKESNNKNQILRKLELVVSVFPVPFVINTIAMKATKHLYKWIKYVFYRIKISLKLQKLLAGTA